MKYFSYCGEVVWHLLDEKDQTLCGSEIIESAFLAGTSVVCDRELTYLDVCETCRRKHEGTDGP